MDQIPSELYYTASHEWIKDNKDGTVTVGITEHAQQALGDIVYVGFPEINSTFSKQNVVGFVESVKTVSDIYMPVSGEVIAINDTLEAEPEKVNQAPYEDGWLFKVKISDKEELHELLTAEAYEQEQ